MKNTKIEYVLLLLLPFFLCGQQEIELNKETTLWYESPAKQWTDAFPLGNGKLGAMCYGGANEEHFQLNEETLWAGCPSNPYPEDYHGKLKTIQKMLLEGENEKANTFGLENMTAAPTSFRSYEPLADLRITFQGQDSITDYKRELDFSKGIYRVTYKTGDSERIRESFVSAVDNALCIRFVSSGKDKINCTIGLKRQKDAQVTAMSDGSLRLDGQIVDMEAPEGYDDNAGGSGEGGKHMRFAARLQSKIIGGSVKADGNTLKIKDANEVILKFTAATDYNLALLNFDASIDPGKKADQTLQKVVNTSWDVLKRSHLEEHGEMFDRASLYLGDSPNSSLPTDERLIAYKDGANDPGLEVQLFQFGRYLLMGSSRANTILPANLQGIWSERMWAPWEADFHLNINLQMNYWPADVTNLSETMHPLINWFEKIVETSKPLAKTIYNSDGWFSHHATNPFGRVTASASTPSSQFNNGVLDPLPGAWMVMSLWDHYEFTQDRIFLKEKLYPMLSGASAFILDVMVADSEGMLHFMPSSSPENQYRDVASGEMLRITSNSTYHLSIIKAVFKATLEAASILNTKNSLTEKIVNAQKALPDLPIAQNGRLMEWATEREEKEPGHRHLSHLLGAHPFSLITEETPEYFEAVRKSLAWREENGHGGMGWAYAHAQLMHARLLDGEKAYGRLKTLLSNGRTYSLLNTIGPFQIDGNLGGTAGVAEMLLQSHLKDEKGNFILHLLPAIPSEWSSGSLTGFKARGNFEVDMAWENNIILSATIYSKNGGACKVRFQDKILDVTLGQGEEKVLTEW